MSDDESTYREGEPFRAVIERFESLPDQLTIYAVPETDDSDASQWITAPKGSYVDLGFCR